MICNYCHAKKFKSESPGIFCRNGKVKLCQLELPPHELLTYMSGDTSESKHFISNIRKYNSTFQMISFSVASIVQHPRFRSTFAVQKQIYHKAGSLLPLQNQSPKFLQLCFIGNEKKKRQTRGALMAQE